MQDFKTLEGATAIFQSLNALGQENNIFLLRRDTQHEISGNAMAAGAAAGMAAVVGIGFARGKDTSSTATVLDDGADSLLVNATESGMYFIALKRTSGITLAGFTSVDKMELVPNQCQFVSYAQMNKFVVKNFSFIQKKIQKVYITYDNDMTMFLIGRTVEKELPYHEANFAKFVAKFKK
ncbi:MAG: hypothetical protein MJ154_01955 [Candidatus Saccharibacteria bacterium]|nr:hypothetical protein [Candidatus Saccharibacteria bacterium]